MIDPLEEILARSQQLTAQLDVDSYLMLNESKRRGIHELDLSLTSELIFKKSLNEKDKLRVVRLLAQKNFDAVRFSSEVNEMDFEDHNKSLNKVMGADVETYLSHHHDAVILNTIENSNKMTEKYVQSHSRKFHIEEWAISRKRFIDSLGHITQHWARKPFSGVIPDKITGPSSSNIKKVDSFTENSGAPVLRSQKITSPTFLENRDSELSTMMQKHIEIIGKLNQKQTSNSDSNSNSNSSIQPILESANQIIMSSEYQKGVDENGLNRLDLVGYKAALEMLSYMVGENRYRKIPNGIYSSICLADIDNSSALSKSVSEKRHFLSLGAKSYFEFQQLQTTTNDIDHCVERGYIGSLPAGIEGTTRTIRLSAYIQYLWQTGHLYPPNVESSVIAISYQMNRPVWPFVYFCLRSGDVNMAIEELDRCIDQRISMVEIEAYQILSIYVRFIPSFQDSGISLMSSELDKFVIGKMMSSVLTPTQITELSHAADKLRAIWKDEMSDMNISPDPYRLLVLNLLSLGDMSCLADPGLPLHAYPLQSYLWANAWFATCERWMHGAMQGFTTITNSSVHPQGENWLYSAVLDYGGETHFDPRGDNPLKYATVLMSCHRFGDAISYLWRRSKTLPAIHLTALCLHYGLILPHVPLAHNPPFKHPTVDSTLINSSDLSPASLMQFYFTNCTTQLLPEVSMIYFISLHSNWLQHVQTELIDAKLQNLVDRHSLHSKATFSYIMESYLIFLNMEQLSRIVGYLTKEGVLSRGSLFSYLDESEIESLLLRCAYHLLHTRMEPEAAIHFYKLCGRFTDAVDELCVQLVNVVSMKDSPFRSHWISVCSRFFETYIQGGIGPVVDCLTTDNRPDLLQSYLLLMNLSQFVSLCYQRKWYDALFVMDEISFLPKTNTEVNTAVNIVLGQGQTTIGPSPKYILQILDDVIVLYMDCLLNACVEARKIAKSSLFTSSQQYERNVSIENLKVKGQALLRFTTGVSSVLVRADTLRTVTMMEMQMN